MATATNRATATLYTWIPDPDYPGEKALPLADLGHSALQVDDLYVSYWPELDHPISRLTQHLHPRQVRNPASLEEEIDPNGPYMRRPPEFIDRVEGLSPADMRECWSRLKDAPYDVNHRNCSHGVLEVLKAGAPPEARGDLDPDLAPAPDSDGIWSKLRAILFRPFTDCIPEKLRAVVLDALDTETVKAGH
jgi:hypothetical protein